MSYSRSHLHWLWTISGKTHTEQTTSGLLGVAETHTHTHTYASAKRAETLWRVKAGPRASFADLPLAVLDKPLSRSSWVALRSCSNIQLDAWQLVGALVQAACVLWTARVSALKSNAAWQAAPWALFPIIYDSLWSFQTSLLFCSQLFKLSWLQFDASCCILFFLFLATIHCLKVDDRSKIWCVTLLKQYCCECWRHWQESVMRHCESFLFLGKAISQWNLAFCPSPIKLHIPCCYHSVPAWVISHVGLFTVLIHCPQRKQIFGTVSCTVWVKETPAATWGSGWGG